MTIQPCKTICSFGLPTRRRGELRCWALLRSGYW